jgi:hypothetical protein
MPPRRRAALVCELHAHTRWSDGSLTLPELVDLYGDAGFDVLCITDHVVAGEEHVHAGNHAAYLAAIDVQAVRARERLLPRRVWILRFLLPGGEGVGYRSTATPRDRSAWDHLAWSALRPDLCGMRPSTPHMAVIASDGVTSWRNVQNGRLPVAIAKLLPQRPGLARR